MQTLMSTESQATISLHQEHKCVEGGANGRLEEEHAENPIYSGTLATDIE